MAALRRTSPDYSLKSHPGIEAAQAGDVNRLKFLFRLDKQVLAWIDIQPVNAADVGFSGNNFFFPYTLPFYGRHIHFQWHELNKTAYAPYTYRPFESSFGTYPAAMVAYAMASEHGNTRDDLRQCMLFLACLGCNPNRKSLQMEVPRQSPPHVHLAFRETIHRICRERLCERQVDNVVRLYPAYCEHTTTDVNGYNGIITYWIKAEMKRIIVELPVIFPSAIQHLIAQYTLDEAAMPPPLLDEQHNFISTITVRLADYTPAMFVDFYEAMKEYFEGQCAELLARSSSISSSGSSSSPSSFSSSSSSLTSSTSTSSSSSFSGTDVNFSPYYYHVHSTYHAD